jgi:ABC-type dipeptide/oligopeptide/nickel transport system permease subunit
MAKIDKSQQRAGVNLRVGVTGFFVVALLLLAIFGPYIVPYDPYQVDMSVALQSPSMEHFLGTDDLGRDEFSRIVVGLRPSLFSALFVVAVDFVIGSVLGVLGGFCGGPIDKLVMWAITTFQSFPSFLLAVVIAGFFGAGLQNACLALITVYWISFARLARGLVMSTKNENYIKAAYLSGNSTLRVLIFHVLPVVLPQLVVTASAEVGSVILSMAGLSFLGLGSQRPTAEWGVMINEAENLLRTSPELALYASLAIIVTVLIFSIFGDALRDWLDKRQSR